MVQTRNLRYQFSAASQIVFPDIRVEAGHSLLIYGQAGSGKTTLLHLLAGLRRPASGQVTVDNQQIFDLSAPQIDQFRGQYIGLVHQQTYFVEALTVWDNLLLSPYATGASKVYVVAERLNIKDLLNQYPSQLNAEQKQQVSIARSVMCTPKLILADEPTNSLENRSCSYVIDLLLEEAIVNDAALVIMTSDKRLKSEINNHILL